MVLPDTIYLIAPFVKTQDEKKNKPGLEIDKKSHKYLEITLIIHKFATRKSTLYHFGVLRQAQKYTKMGDIQTEVCIDKGGHCIIVKRH